MRPIEFRPRFRFWHEAVADAHPGCVAIFYEDKAEGTGGEDDFFVTITDGIFKLTRVDTEPAGVRL